MINEILGIFIMVVGIIFCYVAMVSNGDASEMNTGLLFVILGHSIFESSR